jgi:hypothetical protein
MGIRFGRSRGFWAWLGIIVLQAVAVVLVSPLPASAATGDLECVINFQFTFDPPLTATNTTGPTIATAGFVDCDSPNGNYNDLRSGNVVTTSASVTSSSGPCNLIITIVGDGRIDWNTGETSRLRFTVNTNPANGAITLSATIRSGPLKNDTITAVPAIAHPNLDCALNGLSTLVADLALVLIG